MSAKKGPYLEKCLVVLVPVKSNVSPIISSNHMRCGKFDGTTVLKINQVEVSKFLKSFLIMGPIW